MSDEPTSALTFEDLLIEVARKVGYAYYGAAGDEAAQVPVDPHDLDEAKRTVNNAIRRFLHEGPMPNGWRFTRPTGVFTIWGTTKSGASNTVTGGAYDSGNDQTTLTAGGDSFYETMELKSIEIDGVGTFTIKNYTSPTVIVVTGDASAASGSDWSITADGNYTLPASFSGEYISRPTYTSDTNQGISLDWVSEAKIRKARENISDESGDPWMLAIRPMRTDADPRRRWELMAYPQPDEVLQVEFQYVIGFDKLVDLAETPPVPWSHDETIKSACLAQAELDIESEPGVWSQMYRAAHQQSIRRDAMTVPKKLGYNGNGRGPQNLAQAIGWFRQTGYERPNVTVN